MNPPILLADPLPAAAAGDAAAEGPLARPTGAGRWRVMWRDGQWFDAEVREREAGELEAQISACSPHWHPLGWLEMQGWVAWTPALPAPAAAAA